MFAQQCDGKENGIKPSIIITSACSQAYPATSQALALYPRATACRYCQKKKQCPTEKQSASTPSAQSQSPTTIMTPEERNKNLSCLLTPAGIFTLALYAYSQLSTVFEYP